MRSLAGLAATLLLSAAAFDAPSLFVTGGALAAIALALPAWVALAGTGVRVRRGELPDRLVEGEPVALVYEIRAGLVPMRSRLHDPALDAPMELSAALPLRRRRITLTGALSQRGDRRLPPPSLDREDPLGVRTSWSEGAGATRVLVLPRIEPVLAPAGGSAGTPAELRLGAARANGGPGPQSPDDPELDALGSYRPGTPASRIYWPSLARGGELLERRFAASGGAGALVVIDPTGAEPPELDAAVRAAASLVVHLGRDRGCELLVGGERRRHAVGAGLGGWGRVHARLALVGPEDGAPARAEVPSAGALFWIRASAGAEAQPPGGYLITPGTGSPDPVFTVAGCEARALGTRPAETPGVAV